MVSTHHSINHPNAASWNSNSCFSSHSPNCTLTMLSFNLGSGKCYSQCSRHRSSSQGWSCFQPVQPLPSANTISSNKIQHSCPYLKCPPHPSLQDLIPNDVDNYQWQREGVQNDYYTSSYASPNNLAFETHPFYGNVQDFPGSMEHPPHTRKSGTSERIQELVEPIVFKAAAEKLYSVLTRADDFLHAFIRSFLQEMSMPYMDRTSAWKQKVAHYNRHLLWPIIEDQNEQSEQHENQTATRIHHDKTDFPEYEQQITKSIEVLCHDKLVLTSATDSVYLENNDPRDDSNIEPELPDAHCINIEVRKELAEALVKHVRNMKPVLLRNVAVMSFDHRAARNVLAAIKKLKEIFNVYKICWDPDPRNIPDQRA